MNTVARSRYLDCYKSAVVAFGLSAVMPLLAQPAAESLAGAIDFHCHSAPDTVARSINSFEVVRQARAAGLRAVVLKNHSVSTAAIAQLAMQEIGGVEVFGGIVLNRANGGLNVEAVQKMAQVDGRRGKIVWLPTFDAENQVRFFKEDRPFVRVTQNGRPVPEVAEIFKVIAEFDLVFATGHSSPEESIALIEVARAAGVKRILVTHVLTDPCRATVQQMKRMAQLGAVMEFTWLAHLGGASGPVAGAPIAKPVPIGECASAIKAIGAEHFLLTSDLGQANNPVHTVGLRVFIAALKAEGLNDDAIALLTRKTPARLLGLE
jgi:hypothetical protein